MLECCVRIAPILHYSITPSFLMKLRIGFIGIGAMGFSHVNSIHKLCGDKAQVSAICARNRENIERVLELAPRAKVYTSEHELLASPLDAIFISTPNSTHVQLALEVLKQRKHLFLEKPCGITRE